MLEKYTLIDDTLPIIPTPHDCVIKKVSLENQFLIFEFDDNISEHDSISYIKPKAKSLIIRYHLYIEDDLTLYKWHQPARWSPFKGCYKELSVDKFLQNLKGIEYIGHHVGPCSIIIELFADSSIILKTCPDYVEYEWII